MQLIVTTPEKLEELIKSSLDTALKNHYVKRESEKSKKKQHTIKEASLELNVSPLTIRNYIAKGIIKATKIGRRILISNESLEKAMNEVKSLRHRR